MIEIGTLVRDTLSGDIGIVTGYWTNPLHDTEQVLVKFLTGYWEGETDPCDHHSLEKLC